MPSERLVRPASADSRRDIAVGLTRRTFVLGAGALSLAQVGLLARLATEAAAQLPAPALLPDDPAVRATMAAVADTVVPGPAGGADSAAGAVEAGCVDELYDPFYGVSSTFPAIHDDLVLATPRVLGRPATFDLALPYSDRERVLLDRITPPGNGNPSPALMYQAAGLIVYVAYYGTARSDAGVRYIGFPPHSNGYWPQSSYRVGFRGMTADGNPP
jgi:hypothetical protein